MPNSMFVGTTVTRDYIVRADTCEMALIDDLRGK